MNSLFVDRIANVLLKKLFASLSRYKKISIYICTLFQQKIKMKTNLYFLFALIVMMNCSKVFAQVNFAPVGATWYHSGFEGIYKSIAVKDTLILGKNCRQIKQRIYISWPGPIYRPDLESTRDLYIYSNPDTVFCYNNRINRFSPLFVFNVHRGDTIRLPFFNAPSGCTYIKSDTNKLFSFIIDSIKNVNYDGEILKTVYSKCIIPKDLYKFESQGWFYWGDSLNVYAEKIGSLKTGLLPNCIGECTTLATMGCAAPRNLRCYEDDNIQIHFVDTCLNNTWVPSALDEKTLNDPKLKIFPNPAIDKISLSFESLNFDSRIFIYDAMGKKTIEYSFKKSSLISIDVAELKSGVYFIQILKEGYITIGSGSFIKK